MDQQWEIQRYHNLHRMKLVLNKNSSGVFILGKDADKGHNWVDTKLDGSYKR